MADNTKIEWTDATANYINGCSVVSPGCTNCYAMRLAGTRMKHHPTREGLTTETKAGPVWNGTIRPNHAALQQVLGWKRPRRIFWNAHGDLFHEGVTDEQIDRQFAVMALTPQHIHQVLTKRPDRMRQYLADDFMRDIRVSRIMEQIDPIADTDAVKPYRWPLPNVWLGTSVEDQARADERIPALLATPAAVRFISAEPLLGSVDLRRIVLPGLSPGIINALTGDINAYPMNAVTIDMREYPGLDWVIVGGESGPSARPMHPDYVRSLRDQCAAKGVSFFFKQWGEHWPAELCEDQGDGQPWRFNPDGTAACLLHELGKDRADLRPVSFFRVGKRRAGNLLDGVEHQAMPA